MRKIQNNCQIAASQLLLTKIGGKQVAVPSELSFGFQNLQFGVHTCIESGPGITKTDQRSLDTSLTNANPLIGFLKIEISNLRLQTEISLLCPDP